MRTSVHDDVALPALPLADVVEDRNAARCLHDPPEADTAKLGQPAGQTALRQRGVLRTVVTVHARGVVARRKFRESRRLRRIVFASVTCRFLVFARLGRLQEGNTKFPFGGGNLLSLWRQRRKPAIGRLDNPRCARAGALQGREYLVVGAGDVGLGTALRTPVPASQG